MAAEVRIAVVEAVAHPEAGPVEDHRPPVAQLGHQRRPRRGDGSIAGDQEHRRPVAGLDHPHAETGLGELEVARLGCDAVSGEHCLLGSLQPGGGPGLHG